MNVFRTQLPGAEGQDAEHRRFDGALDALRVRLFRGRTHRRPTAASPSCHNTSAANPTVMDQISTRPPGWGGQGLQRAALVRLGTTGVERDMYGEVGDREVHQPVRGKTYSADELKVLVSGCLPCGVCRDVTGLGTGAATLDLQGVRI